MPLGLPAVCWLAFVAAGAVFGQRHGTGLDGPTDLAAVAHRVRRLGPAACASASLAAAIVACLAAWAGAIVVRAFWFARSIPLVGPAMTRRRLRAWRASDTEAANAAERGDTSAAARHARRRNSICLAEPARPTWMADRVSALETRVAAEHGLDLPVTLPHLWLGLPAPARQDLRVLCVSWYRAFLLGAWAVWFTLTGTLWWPAGPAGVMLWLGAVGCGRRATDAFCAYLEAAVDLHLPSLLPSQAYPGPCLTALARKGT